ncbi:MAG: glycine cleavage system protein GcvH [Planctomycetota bacterium]|jgi:glycine cleavage system H protein
MADRPADRKYTKTHEWVLIEGEIATVGITDFAIEHLGDLVFVELPDVGRSLDIGESAAEVESVKAVGEIYSPVAGEVTAVNEELTGDQGPLSADPFGAGWLFRVKLAGASEDLMDLAAYEAQVAAES